MNISDENVKNKKNSLSPKSEFEDFSSGLDSFPMQAALGIYTMNPHTDNTENKEG